jgi:hypothetical protein
MSLTELPEYKLLIVCIYRSPEGQVDKFFRKVRTSCSEIINEGKNFDTLRRLEHRSPS